MTVHLGAVKYKIVIRNDNTVKSYTAPEEGFWPKEGYNEKNHFAYCRFADGDIEFTLKDKEGRQLAKKIYFLDASGKILLELDNSSW